MFKLENILIRESLYTDLNSIYEISKTSFTDSWNLKSYKENFKSQSSKYFSLFLKNELIGFLSTILVENEVNITNIAINENFRGKGLGKIFLGHVLNELKGCEFFLEVRESNKKAIALYKSFDFVEISKRINYYRNPFENAIIMKKF